MVDNDIETRDSAFLWESEALRSSQPRPVPPTPVSRDPGITDSDWLTLRQANGITGIPIPTLRKWARHDHIPSYLAETSVGQLRMVSLKGIQARATELGRELKDAPQPTHKPAPTPPATPVATPVEPEVPPGTMLVPIDAWDKMLLQLGNLHEAGQQLAEARERAAKAETESKFLKERLTELRSDLAEARSKSPPRASERQIESTSPISHIPIETDEDDESDDLDIPVRDLGKAEATDTEETPGEEAKADNGMTITEYSLEMAKHLYSTWRRRPKR